MLPLYRQALRAVFGAGRDHHQRADRRAAHLHRGGGSTAVQRVRRAAERAGDDAVPAGRCQHRRHRFHQHLSGREERPGRLQHHTGRQRGHALRGDSSIL